MMYYFKVYVLLVCRYSFIEKNIIIVAFYTFSVERYPSAAQNREGIHDFVLKSVIIQVILLN